MNGITLKINVQYSEISEHILTAKKEHIIKFKNGDKLTLTNGNAKRTFKNLQRQFPGDNLH